MLEVCIWLYRIASWVLTIGGIAALFVISAYPLCNKHEQEP